MVARRFSTSRWTASLQNYVAYNEPVLGFEKGSKERQELESKLKEYNSKLHEVPIVIGDEQITTKDVRYQVRPFDHQNKLARFYYADKSLIKKSIDTCLKAHRDWEKRPLEERAKIFRDAGDLVTGKYRMDILAATMLGQAKTIVQAEIDAACELADFFHFNAQWAMDLQKWKPVDTKESKNSIDYRSSEGFWAAIAPFNFTAIGGHLAGAPAMMGNSVIWKSSDTAMLSNYIVFTLLREAGVPAGVINFVPADGPVFGDTVTASKDLAGINFTGSAKTFHHLWQQVGIRISHYKTFPRLIGECGGKNFHFVHQSANVESVINGTIRSAFEYGGQKCSACSRMYVPQSLWPKIKEGLVEAQKQIKYGSPLEADSFLSAVIDDKAYDRVKSYVDYGKKNLKLVAGGKCDNSKGYYIEPTIFEVTDPKDKILQEEIFGPVLSVYVYKDTEYKDILKLIDTTSPYALTGAIYSQDSSVLYEAKEALRYSAGNIYLNDKSTGSVVAQQPFGGARKSGTNDKAGSPHYLLKFVSPLSVKHTNVPATVWKYKYMEN